MKNVASSTQSETTSAAATADSLNLPTVLPDSLSTALSTTPSGPATGHPLNVSIEKMAQGWVVSWLPPFEPQTPVAYYSVQHKEGEGEWVMSESISKDTAYLSKFTSPWCFVPLATSSTDDDFCF